LSVAVVEEFGATETVVEGLALQAEELRFPVQLAVSVYCDAVLPLLVIVKPGSFVLTLSAVHTVGLAVTDGCALCIVTSSVAEVLFPDPQFTNSMTSPVPVAAV
jgi:hypothetical protein